MSTKFSDAILCTYEDVENEVGDLTSLAPGESPAEQREIIQRAINAAQKLITNRLKSTLPDIYSRQVNIEVGFSTWYSMNGFPHTDTDPALDRITNSSVLKSATVALVLVCLIKRMIVQFKASYSTSLSVLGDQRAFWQSEYETRIHDAEKELILEINPQPQPSR